MKWLNYFKENETNKQAFIVATLVTILVMILFVIYEIIVYDSFDSDISATGSVLFLIYGIAKTHHTLTMECESWQRTNRLKRSIGVLLGALCLAFIYFVQFT